MMASTLKYDQLIIYYFSGTGNAKNASRWIIKVAEEQGIKVIKQEENHSSKCSFLDNEPIEHHNKYLGRRITRGLFESQTGTIINADVNGAYNIMKKAFLNAVEADRIEDVGLHPTRWRLAAVTS